MIKKLSSKTVYLALMVIVLIAILAFFRTAQSASSDDGPTDILLSGQLVQENASNGTYIGTLSALDPNNDQSELVFFLTSDGAGRFEIDSSNRLVQVAEGNNLLDYESKGSYDVVIVVRDPDWNTYQETFTIYINNMNEAPTGITFSSNSVIEDSAPGTVIGTLSAIDQDAGDVHTFSLLNDANGKFSINGANVVVASSSLAPGTYDIQVKVVDAVSNVYEKYFSVAVSAIDAPVLSDSSVTTSSGDSTSISWQTDKTAQSRVEYGLTSSYGKMTNYTTAFTESQEVELPELLDCTTYSYRVHSVDAYGKETIGEDQTLTTGGCAGEASVYSSVQSEILKEAGGVVQLKNEDQEGITVNVPESFSAKTENAYFQVKKLDVDTVLDETGIPGEDWYSVGGHMYELSAVDQSTEDEVEKFDEDVRVTLNYSDSDVSIMDESTLKIFHWNGSEWEGLSRCVVDELNNSVTCVTKSFSPFAVFGQMAPIARNYSGKAKTLRRRGMAQTAFRGTSVESGVNKQNFEAAYKESLEEVARLNEGTAGTVRVAMNDEGEEVFRGYRPGKIPLEQFRKEDRPLIVYRGSPRSGRSVAKGNEEKTLVSRITDLRKKLGDTEAEKVAAEEKKERMQLVTQEKMNMAKTLLQIYQIAAEEMALCLENDSNFCDEIYQLLSSEVAAKEMTVLQGLIEGVDWEE